MGGTAFRPTALSTLARPHQGKQCSEHLHLCDCLSLYLYLFIYFWWHWGLNLGPHLLGKCSYCLSHSTSPFFRDGFFSR
jgi:hypothetical protein